MGGKCQRLCSATASFLNGMPALSSPPRSVLLPSPCFAGLGVEAGGLGNRQGLWICLQIRGYLLSATGTLGSKSCSLGVMLMLTVSTRLCLLLGVPTR